MADEQSALLRPGVDDDNGATPSVWGQRRERAQDYLASKQKHYLVLGLVTLDVLAILTDILVSLVTCDMNSADEPWVEDVRDATKICGIVISCLFLVELLLCVWAFSIEFFYSWFHCFDAAVIVISFIIDVVAHGIVEEIGSLVVILRLWRLVKIVEEMSLGASERMEELEEKLVLLEKENADLHERLRGHEGGH